MHSRIPDQPIIFSRQALSLENIMSIAERGRRVQIDRTPEFRQVIEQGVTFLEKLLREEGVIYGVTTGYGEHCTRPVPPELVDELPLHLSRFHGCGMGSYFSHSQSRAIMAVRLCSLAKGYSGVRYELLEQLATLLNHDIIPLIPQEGSVGASGDLTPLSYVAATLIGERQVRYRQHTEPAETVFRRLGISPLTLRPKEGLAIMNGTAVMTALACEAYQRSAYLAQLACRVTAMASIALQGNASHYEPRLFAAKPHAGQNRAAARIYADLSPLPSPRNPARLQDRYSLRCAPHIIGVLEDSLPWIRQLIETELNSANDNPLIDGEAGQVLHGGHFYGGHIATVMDTLKAQVANLADMADRQMALLTDTRFNNGLPPNLSMADPERAPVNHGFKAIHIGVSAWTAEALKHATPASVFSRSTECHNQDKVSMGTIAARDALRVLELGEQVFAAHLLATTQGLMLRQQQRELDTAHLADSLNNTLASVSANFTPLDEDRPLEESLRQFTTMIRQRYWPLYTET